ncbi:beta-ketoacyl-ACP synthase II [Oribacterium sp. WCC10]|uniref:beta-ketoacyl-ACP synthase II n=1 Tax=Oribacterium sp. WCC10 TaxID=1855343 RepID=UPI0008E1E8B0|nr:beta-ketoacyl-ACP synthase II [Oribacterium sp. WCC10]SFG33395.1 3-oxoacyl-[acyl-carrier-protein] synthase II [Oribacterium sp. WCC10]
MDNKRRVVITGIGTVNPTGNNVSESWENIQKGYCGIGPITHFDTENFTVKLAGEVKNFDPSEIIDRREQKHMSRFTQFAIIAAEEAIRQSGIKDSDEYDASRIGVIVSSGIGALDTIEAEHSKALNHGFERVSPFFIPMTISNMAAANVAIRNGFKGMCTCPVTACAGGSNAIGDAFHRVRDGYEDVMIAGGTEACISPLGIGGFSSMRALNHSEDPNRASIPFDNERSGFVMGEGAGIIVMEEREHAIRRGAKIIAEIVGYGANCDAYHITSPNPEGEGGADCMRLAIKDAGIDSYDISYINAHGTSTHLNDSCETKAIKSVFGDHAYDVPVSSTKSMTGHLLGAAGGVEAVFCVKALQDGFIPATINYRNADPECDLDVVPNEGRKADLKYALSNSLGFGGHNACLIFAKA